MQTDYLALYEAQVRRNAGYGLDSFGNPVGLSADGSGCDASENNDDGIYRDYVNSLESALEEDVEQPEENNAESISPTAARGDEGAGYVELSCLNRSPTSPSNDSEKSSPQQQSSSSSSSSAAAPARPPKPPKPVTKRSTSSVLSTLLRGGEHTHIELCTVDCSTYLLYPPHSTLLMWLSELTAAGRRVIIFNIHLACMN